MRRGQSVWALGTMSGTSLDGVDAALLETDGDRIVGFGRSSYRPYWASERAGLHAALGRWPGEPGVAAAEAIVNGAHADVMAGFDEAEIAGFHGQTLAHDPRGRGTHQAGDGAALANALGLPVVWDFRSADVAAGGQGAPLAPFFHFACASWFGAMEPVVFLNLGGVGNLTWVDPRHHGPEAAGACVAFDTGPANAPLNDLMHSRRRVAQDADGALAATGVVDETVIAAFLAQGYFAAPPPKSLDRNDFAALAQAVEHLGDADAAATLTAAAAAAVATALPHLPVRPTQIMATGGGRKNPVLMAMIAARTGLRVIPVEAVGLDGDMLEAQAFAYLAVRVALGLPTSAPGTTGVAAPVCGGRTSRPG